MLKNKSQDGTGSGASEAAKPAVSTGARSRASRKTASKPISKGPGLSDNDVINIAMNGLNDLQEHFGRFFFVPPTGPDEPALLVMPKTLSVCEQCGRIILATDGNLCNLHRSKPSESAPPFTAQPVKTTVYVGSGMPNIVLMLEEHAAQPGPE